MFGTETVARKSLMGGLTFQSLTKTPLFIACHISICGLGALFRGANPTEHPCGNRTGSAPGFVWNGGRNVLWLSSSEQRYCGIGIFKNVQAYFNKPGVDLLGDNSHLFLLTELHRCWLMSMVLRLLLNRRILELRFYRCMIHRQVLVVKQLEPELETVMKDVVRIVDAVKSNALYQFVKVF